MRVLSNEDLDTMAAEDAAAQGAMEGTLPPEEVVESQQDNASLAGYVRGLWSDASQSKSAVQERLLVNLRNFNAEYSPQKLGEIRKLKGSEVFIPLKAIKVNAANAWISDIYFNSQGEVPWDIESTPVPELPLSVEEEVRGQVMMEVTNVVAQYAAATGQDPFILLQQYKPQIIKRIMYALRKRSSAATGAA